MDKPIDGKKAKTPQKPYEKPSVTKLTPEQAKLKLLVHASDSHKGGAKGLLGDDRFQSEEKISVS
jgi:hypothetical protein